MKTPFQKSSSRSVGAPVSRYLLDTSVLSDLVRKRPKPSIVAELRRRRSEGFATSAICVAELRFGARRHPLGLTLWTRIRSEVLSRVEVLPFDEDTALHVGDILAQLEASGEKIGFEDAAIAATALRAGLVLVTANLRHFTRIEGLTVETW